MTHSSIAAVVLGATVALATGCASSATAPLANQTSVARAPTLAPPSPSRSVRPSLSASVPASASASASVSAARAGACGPDDVRITVGPGEGAAGSEFLTFTVTNRAQAGCATGGFPVLELQDNAGLPLVTGLTQEGSSAPAHFSLAPGASAQFTVGYSKVPQGGEDCAPAAKIAVTLPGVEDPVVVPVSGVAPCGGDLRVRPLAPAR